MLTLDKVLHIALQTLKEASIPTPELDAKWLLAHTLKRPLAFILSHPEYRLTPEELVQFTCFIQKRASGIPYAYLVGEAGFWDLTLMVTPDVLIPRPETECLVQLALQDIPDNKAYQILDLGTGSGAIGLAIAKHRPTAHVTLIDFSHAALKIAQHNARQLKISNTTFLQSHWFAALPPHPSDRYDLIISNPPYLAPDDIHLSGDIRHEPRSALVSEEHGLQDLKHIIETTPHFLKPHGKLMLEHGYTQGPDVQQLFRAYGFTEIQTHRDLAGHERVSEGEIE